MTETTTAAALEPPVGDRTTVAAALAPLLKLDFGCGPRPREGFEGIDAIDFGQKHVMDVRKTPWPWEDESVGEVFSSHFLEHLKGKQRVPFINELWRVMAWGATATIVVPHWSHACAYGDPQHAWPPMSEWWPMYLERSWREANAPHAGYACDFDWTVAFSTDPKLATRAQDYIMFAIGNYVNNWRDMIISLTKRRR